MPRGIPGSGKAALRKPADGGAVTTPPPTPPTSSTAENPSGVREQIKQMSGFANREELRAAIPETTSAPIETPQRKKYQRKAVEVETDPLMTDPKYKQAIGNMMAFGGKKVIGSGFATAATALRDERFRLSEEEEQTWDEFFYVVSKRSNFDPTSPWFLAIYAVVMLLTQLGSRLWERSGHKGLFAMFDKITPKEPKKTPTDQEQPKW